MTAMAFKDFMLERMRQFGFKNPTQLALGAKKIGIQVHDIIHGNSSPGPITGRRLAETLNLNLKELLIGSRTGTIFIEKACGNIPYNGDVIQRQKYGQESVRQYQNPKERDMDFIAQSLRDYKEHPVVEDLVESLYVIFEASLFPLGVKTLRALAANYYSLGTIRPQPKRKKR